MPKRDGRVIELHPLRRPTKEQYEKALKAYKDLYRATNRLNQYFTEVGGKTEALWHRFYSYSQRRGSACFQGFTIKGLIEYSHEGETWIQV